MKDILLDKIKNSLLIDDTTKSHLLSHYWDLSENQKHLIINYLDNDEKKLSNFLLDALKNSEITLYDLKKSKNDKNIKLMQEEEQKSKIKESNEISKLLDTVY